MAGAELLAVYGSLLRGLGHQERLGVAAGLELVGPCVLAGTLYELGWYPGVWPGGPGRVAGELYRVPDPGVFTVLDRYEGADPHDPDAEYRRVRARLVTPEVEAWVYVLAREPEGAPVVEGGDWRRHVGRRAG
jgi:gamma-glutamylcyclotransferase (GGCT)/AIG2-like uncharacterized protein YtfP